VVGRREAEPVRKLVDRALEARVLECDELAALGAYEMVVMMLADGIGGLVAGDPIAEVETVDEVVSVQQLEHAIDARPTDRPLSPPPASQRIFDLQCAQRTCLIGEEVDYTITGRATVVTGPPERAAGVLSPIGARVSVGGGVGDQVAKHSCRDGRFRVRVGLVLMRLRLALILC
jgi:hypothetical protein